MDYKKINSYLLQKQYLQKKAVHGNIVTIAKDLLGLHATMNKTPYLSLFIRQRDFTMKDYENEFNDKKTLGKIRSVRKTVFVYPKMIISWIFSATKDLYLPRLDQYLKITGISRNYYNLWEKKILNILKGKCLTAQEIKEELKAEESLSLIINLLCDQCKLIRGMSKSWKSSTYKYHLFSEYFPDLNLNEYSTCDAQNKLLEAYLDSYGPVTVTDICWWTGFNKKCVTEYINTYRDELYKLKPDGADGIYYHLKRNKNKLDGTESLKTPHLNLLPAQDPFIMGYKDRDRYLSKEYYYNVFDKAGNGTSVILKEGNIIGVWDYEEKPEPKVKLYFFKKPVSATLNKTIKLAEKYGFFIMCKQPEIIICKNMIPLSRRKMGGFMSPLKDL